MIRCQCFAGRRRLRREARIVAWVAANPGREAHEIARGARAGRRVYRDLGRLTEQGRVVRGWRAVEGGGRAHYTVT